MNISGNLLKMRTVLDVPVRYTLRLNDQNIEINNWLGKRIRLEYQNEINCIKCGRVTKKSFAQGFCYPCFISAPETEECVLRPELCRAHEGIARDLSYAENNCLIDHFVYLSLTNTIKVGVTRMTQVPTRWIDQGAVKAIKLAKTPNRYAAGLIEVNLKKHLADKTNWRNMLTGKITDSRSLYEVREFTFSVLQNDLKKYFLEKSEITTIEYPMLEHPAKVTALNFDKIPNIEGTLTGIKGQYLILNNSQVLNIRKFGGYKVLLTE